MTDAILSHEIRLVLELKEQLQSAFVLHDEDVALWDTIEGETSLKDRLVAMLRIAKEREAHATALGEMMNNMQARKKRMEDGANKLRNLVAWAMGEVGMKKLEAPDLTASLGKGRAPLLVLDDEQAAYQFPRKVEPQIDRAKLREYLEINGPQPYATLGNPSPTLTVRTK